MYIFIYKNKQKIKLKKNTKCVKSVVLASSIVEISRRTWRLVWTSRGVIVRLRSNGKKKLGFKNTSDKPYGSDGNTRKKKTTLPVLSLSWSNRTDRCAQRTEQ